jgi:hypothetical protein
MVCEPDHLEEKAENEFILACSPNDKCPVLQLNQVMILKEMCERTSANE